MPTLDLIGVEIAPTKVIPNEKGGPTTEPGTRRVFSEDLRERERGHWPALGYVRPCPAAELVALPRRLDLAESGARR
jgi:hypothetical protein